MARDDGKNGTNGADDVRAERGMATLSTLRYVNIITYATRCSKPFLRSVYSADDCFAGLVRRLW